MQKEYNYSIDPCHNFMGFKYSVDENFFKKWNANMAYVLVFLYADGSLEDSTYIRGKYLRVSSIDKEVIELIKSSLQAQHPITVIPPCSIAASSLHFRAPQDVESE